MQYGGSQLTQKPTRGKGNGSDRNFARHQKTKSGLTGGNGCPKGSTDCFQCKIPVEDCKGGK